MMATLSLRMFSEPFGSLVSVQGQKFGPNGRLNLKQLKAERMENHQYSCGLHARY